jgi:hypothetical protein
MRLQTPRRAVPQTNPESSTLAPKLEPTQLLDLRQEEVTCFPQEVTSSYSTISNTTGISGAPFLAAMDEQPANARAGTIIPTPNTPQILVQALPPATLPAWAAQALATLTAGILVLVAARLMAPPNLTPNAGNIPYSPGFAMPVVVSPYAPSLPPQAVAKSAYAETSNRPCSEVCESAGPSTLSNAASPDQDATGELISLAGQGGEPPPEDVESLNSDIPEIQSADYPSTDFHTLLAERTSTGVPPPLPFIESTEAPNATSEVPPRNASTAIIKLEGRIEPYRNE